MLALAIESATELAAVALADESGVIATASLSRGRRHAEWIAPSVEFVCHSAGVAAGDVEAVCVDVGPGLFTGLRVGIAFAKGLAFALGVPVASATSLEILAQALCGAGAGDLEGALLVPVVDARRGEVFSACFEVESRPGAGRSLARVADDARWSPDELARSLASSQRPLVLAGDGLFR
ncbi:MAG: tRNA (adenosine(37)-N6)-threonylcarbamoyltransferase complex dimerization subunit type 1 TsaB, partial [Acidimicrobiales bacterium]